jgi:hypothetical protein
MLPSIGALFKAYDNVDPAPKQQKAVTPKLLQKMYGSSGARTIELRGTAPAVAADLVIGAFFFAKRGYCEYTTTLKPGKTKIPGKAFGGKARFGFDPHEIGNKSIRSGAAMMALFLQNVSSDRIMIL